MIRIEELREYLAVLLRDELVAGVRGEGEEIVLSFLNGQQFLIKLEQSN